MNFFKKSTSNSHSKSKSLTSVSAMSDKAAEHLNRVMSRFMAANKDKDVFHVVWNPETYEAEISSKLKLADYQAVTHTDDWGLLFRVAESMKGKSIVFINPTYQGGGVAMLRPPLIHILRLLGVDAHWFVMKPHEEEEPNPFIVTKKIHNISQRQSGDFVTEVEMKIHEDWAAKNAAVLMQQPEIRKADIVAIDDPQPAPLKRFIEQVNPSVKFVWRNHIDTSHTLMAQTGTPQHQVAEYVMKRHGIGESEAALTHPVEEFIHPDMEDKTYFGPATIEGFDDLNKDLTKKEILDGITFINAAIREKNYELDPDDQMPRIDVERPRICLVARFDESKGMDRAMEIGVQVRRRLRDQGVSSDKLPQVIIVGNGSIDDPSGIPMFEAMLRLRRERYPEERDGIILARLVHNYKAMNSLMYLDPKVEVEDAAPLFGMQTSEAEGMETRITDWIKHGVPVVITRRGGMPLQVKHGKSGYIISDADNGQPDLKQGADFIIELLSDHQAYMAMRQSTLEVYRQYNAREFSTISNVIRWLRLGGRVLEGKPADRKWLISEPEFYQD